MGINEVVNIQAVNKSPSCGKAGESRERSEGCAHVFREVRTHALMVLPETPFVPLSQSLKWIFDQFSLAPFLSYLCAAVFRQGTLSARVLCTETSSDWNLGMLLHFK